MEEIYKVTGGKGFTFNDSQQSVSLDSVLNEIIQYVGPVNQRPVTVSEKIRY